MLTDLAWLTEGKVRGELLDVWGKKMKFVDTVQTITSRNYDYTDSEVEDALDDYGIDISKKARKSWEQLEIQQEAEDMHKYVNILSLERSVNLWAAAAKEEGKDPEPVSGSKTLTKKSQNKVEINPAEKIPQNIIKIAQEDGYFKHYNFEYKENMLNVFKLPKINDLKKLYYFLEEFLRYQLL